MASDDHRVRGQASWLSIRTAATILDVSTKTIRRRIATGELPAYRCGKRGIRIKSTDLEAMLHRIPTVRHL